MSIDIASTNEARIVAKLSFGEIKQLILDGLPAKAGFVPGRDDLLLEQFEIQLKPRGDTFTLVCDVVLVRDNERSKAKAH